jgi:hypothetical protein
MAAAELIGAQRGSRAAPRRLRDAWLWGHAAVWGATLSAAVVVTLVGEPARLAARQTLGLALTPGHTPPPTLAHVLELASHNIPIAAWPLLLGVAGAPRRAPTRALLDALALGCLLANTIPVGAALATYAAHLLPYVVQLPLEWAALALGYGTWLVERRRALRGIERLSCLAIIALLLLCGALLETFAVPHR